MLTLILTEFCMCILIYTLILFAVVQETYQNDHVTHWWVWRSEGVWSGRSCDVMIMNILITTEVVHISFASKFP